MKADNDAGAVLVAIAAAVSVSALAAMITHLGCALHHFFHQLP